MNKRFLVVGLGNPGEKYAQTRHNVGFWVVEALANRWKVSAWDLVSQAMLARADYAGWEVLLLKPLTYMNHSGQAVAAAQAAYGLSPDRICLVYDDLNLEVATLRVRRKGSAGGHRGVQSVIEQLGTQDFPRVRIGIGSPNGDPVAYVLSPFEAEERPLIERAVEQAADAVMVLIERGVDAAMNQFNRRGTRENGASQPAQSGTPTGRSSDPA